MIATRLVCLLALCALAGAALPFSSAAAQAPLLPTQPFADWRTVETPNFIVHYPHAMAEWTLPLAARLEAVHAGVSEVVGNSPENRITVLVMDPYNLSNGSALSFLDAPTLILWPTPPGPRSDVGHNRGWSDLLAVHEYGHLAHLTFPSRNPRERALWRLLPVQVGPIARRAPRWAMEGYATYIEGRLTGSGRPHGAFRAAVLRQWALEGKLPAYSQLSSSDRFFGGRMAYLVGSAFLEWLADEHGDESLNSLWRRLSARERRSFAEAFRGVYGDSPESLYGQFTLELTRRSLAVEAALERSEIVDGATFQRMDWFAGDPALSPDGGRMAIEIGARDRPSRVVIWNTGQDAPDPRAAQARAQLLRRDPEDVPALQAGPEPRRALAVLRPVDGRPHLSPRFLPDGRYVLVSRSEPLGDGTFRPDLFLWDWAAGDLLRVTKGAGVRDADPSPAGRTAVGVRCLNGICDLVRVDLETGAVVTIHTGYPDLVFSRPRYSPNGRQIVVSVQRDGRWRLAITDQDGAPLRYLPAPDGASRYDATFLPGGDSIVAVSEAEGIPNLEVISLATGESHPLTRVTSLAVAPEPHPFGSEVFFLQLRGDGMNVQRINRDSAAAAPLFPLSEDLFPIVPRAIYPDRSDTFNIAEVDRPVPYGAGPGNLRVLPGGAAGAAGQAIYGVLSRTDPVGRLGWTVQAAYGSDALWSGGGASITWRGFRPAFRADAFAARQQPSQTAIGEAVLPALDVDYVGSLASVGLTRDWGFQRHSYEAGASAGYLRRTDEVSDSSGSRRFAYAQYTGTFRQETETRYFAQTLAAGISAGHTAGRDWTRIRTGLTLEAGIGGKGIRTDFAYGQVPSDAPPFERFLAGGPSPLLFSSQVLTQRISAPMLPLGILEGSQIAAAGARLLVGPLHPYIWAATTDQVFRDWYRVIGVEREFASNPSPILRIPSVDVRLGLGYTLDDPFKNKLRGYLSVGYRP